MGFIVEYARSEIMIFTEEDIKRIAKNIKTIRLAYGYKTQLDFALALDPNARYPGLSHDMIKKYESGKYPITEQAVRLISSLTLCSFEDIVFEDLDDLEPDSLVLNSYNIEELRNDKDLLEGLGNDLCNIFPLFKSKKSLNEPSFSKAYQISIKKLNTVDFKEEDLVEAVNTFALTNYTESYLNIMSLVGRLYVNYIYWGMKRETLDKIKIKKHDNYIEYAKDFYRYKGYEENSVFMAEIKRKFLEIYNGTLTVCMQEAAKEDKYKDYVYYYLGVRYYFGIMDNYITRMSDTEMNSFGINMIDCLEIIGNKYAIEFKKIMKD